MELLLTERMILESLSFGEKTIDKIAEDTGIELEVINSIVPELLMRNILIYTKGIYNLNMENKESWIFEINKLSNKKKEIKDILNASIELLGEKDSLKLKKVYLTGYEEKLLKIELKKVETFIENIRVEHSRIKSKNKTKDLRVVYWGCSKYSDLVESDVSCI
ncbi:hypothetical protein A9Q84_05640 [Halobacteriovorax marinus]|uniref:Uncharacterized protein n=1 Tax=Halobacteriovorax marinus TaxID=97084 RepID=A0A1Y5FHT8_9BACT|nr:hypothetical protein A9Q84_05640 [Halobacteriovorax marinus]